MNVDETFASSPGARVTPIAFSSVGSGAEEYETRSGNGTDNYPRPITLRNPGVPPFPSQRSVPTPTRLSIVLQPSPIKAEEYLDHQVIVTDVVVPVKKQGRPTGWKPGMSYAEMRGGVAPSRTARTMRPGRQVAVPNYSLKRRRRTVAREESLSPRELYLKLKPTFTRFVCEWSGCPADLHNLETLRRHVRALHVETEGQTCCRWAKCGAKPAGAACLDGKALLEHLEQAHLIPISWHVGDGPKNSYDWSVGKKGDGEDVADFLKDKDGNQVTPSTRDQEVEDWITFRNNRRKLKELLVRRDENLESDDEKKKGIMA